MTWINRGSVKVWDGPAEALDPVPRPRRHKPVLTEPQVEGLNGKEAARAAGITYRQLDFWTRRGYLQAAPRPEGSGSGCVRTYTAGEIRVAELFGVSTRTIRLRLNDAGLTGKREAYRPKPEPAPVVFDYREEPWQVSAECLHEDPELFYPERVSEAGEALDVCNTRCAVRDACLDYALRAEGTRGLSYRGGIWGGTTPDQRYQMSLERQEGAA